ncbi:MAG TPA: hypothetical protein VGM32_25215, partial [Rhodopila sp.]
VLNMAYSKADLAGLGTFVDSAVSTSPLGSTWIQRGCRRLVANALTLSPGAAVGVCPGAHPLAVGILSVGILPCGLAGGIVGVVPQAGCCTPAVRRRSRSAESPINATTDAKMSDESKTPFPPVHPTR